MAAPSSFSLLFFSLIFLIIPHFSRASPYALAHRLRSAMRLSASPAVSGGAVTMELWCVAKNNAENSALQSALDWACGAGGADCGAIQQGGPCYDAADILRMASYAFNDYFLKHGLTEDSCNFDGTAALTSLNPSRGSCKLPSSSSVHNGSFSGSSTAVGIGPTTADLSGGNYLASTWCFSLIIIHFLYAIALVVEGL